MLYDVLIFIPFFACLFWILTTCWVASKTNTFYPVLTTLFVMMLYVFTDCCYASPNIPPRMLVYSSILAEFSAPSLIPLIWIYQLRLRGQEHFQPSQMLWLLLPSMLGFFTLMLTVLAGPGKIQEFQTMIYAGGFSLDIPADETILIAYYFVTTWLFRGVLVVEALAYIILDIRLMHKHNLRMRHLQKLFQGERVRVLELQVFTTLLVFISFLPKMFMTHAFLMSHPWVSAVLAIWIAAGICIFCFFSFFGSQERISIREMHSVMRYNYNRNNKTRIVEQMLNEMVEEADDEVLWRLHERIGRDLNPDDRQGVPSVGEAPRSLAADIFSAVSKSWDDDSLLSRFQQLMLHGQAFLEPGLTLGDVAERLHSNKTYISRLVNNTYNLAFPDLINTLRVDYAEQYIVLHRDARQNEIATACGFTSASSFNNIFKKVTGMTPKIWLATVDHQGHGPAPALDVADHARDDE